MRTNTKHNWLLINAEKPLLTTHQSSGEIKRQLAQVRVEFPTTSQVLQAFIGQSVGSFIIGFFIKTRKIT